MAVAQFMLDGRRFGLRLYRQLLALRASANVSHAPFFSCGGSFSFLFVSFCFFFQGNDSVAHYNCAVLLLQAKFFEEALETANELFESASDLPHWLAVRTGLLIAEVGLHLAREEGELSPQISNVVTNALDWIDARGSLATPPESDGDAPEGSALKMAVHTYRAKFALVSGQKNTCKREIKAAAELLDSGGTGLNLGLSVVRAHLHFSLSDYSNALEMIGSIANLADPSMEDPGASTIYFNNLGCIHYKMKKLNAAGYYFARALSADEKTVNLTRGGSNSQRYYEVLYNLGVTLLAQGKSQLAFECFNEALQSPRYGWWRYWLRIAECVILTHTTLLKADRKKFKNNLGVESGNGERSRLILPSTYVEGDGIPFVANAGQSLKDHQKQRKNAPPSSAGSGGAAAGAPEAGTSGSAFAGGSQDGLSLRYALECLTNARALLWSEKPLPKPSLDQVDEDAEWSCCIRGPPAAQQKDRLALIVALLETAYLALVCEDPCVALEAASQVFTLTDASLHSDYMHLAHVYCAEALTLQNRYDEALVHLTPPATTEDTKDDLSLLAKGVGGMRVVLYTNFVTVLIFRGELDRAQAVLQAALQLTTNPSPDLYLLQAYLTLKRGDTASVLMLLKRGRPLPRRAPKTK